MQSLGWEQWVLRAGGLEGGLGQTLAKGPDWASWVLGPGDSDPSSPELAPASPRRGERPVGALSFRLHVQVTAVPGKDPQRRWRAVRGLQAQQVGVCATHVAGAQQTWVTAGI